MTCFFFSFVGAFQFDIKKIIAYSTCSQLGYMFFSCAVSNYSLGLFHLFNHAFFKALLFLSMGSIIHALNDEQDLRKMGGLIRLLPFTYIVVLLGSIALMGFPFLTGFYSKDFLLEFVFVRFSILSIFLYILGIMGAFFSAFYSIRLIYWVFFVKPNFYRIYLEEIYESVEEMRNALLILAFSSIFIGFVFSDQLNGIGSFFFDNSIYQKSEKYCFFDAEFYLFFLKYVPLIISIIGVISYFILNKVNLLIVFDSYFIYLYSFFAKVYFFDFIFIDFFFDYIFKISYSYFYKLIEKKLMESIFIIYILNSLKFMFNILNNLNKGDLVYYFFLIVYFFLIFFFFLQIYNIFDYIYIFFLFIFVLNI